MNNPVKNGKAPKNAPKTILEGEAAKGFEARNAIAPLPPQTVEEILTNPSGEGVDMLVREGQPVDKVAEAIKAANATKEAQEKARKKKEESDEQARNVAIAKTIIKQASNACKAKLSDKKGAAEALQIEGKRFAGAQAKMVGMKPAEIMKEAMEWMIETDVDDEETGFSSFFFA